jgi:hypothetical protein
MFQMLFGKRKEEESGKGKPRRRRVTAADIRVFAKTHNTLLKSGKIQVTKDKKVKK